MKKKLPIVKFVFQCDDFAHKPESAQDQEGMSGFHQDQDSS